LDTPFRYPLTTEEGVRVAGKERAHSDTVKARDNGCALCMQLLLLLHPTSPLPTTSLGTIYCNSTGHNSSRPGWKP